MRLKFPNEFRCHLPAVLFSFFILCSVPSRGFAESVSNNTHVQVELFPEVLSVKPGKPFWVGVRLKMDEHWHTYWKNPGDSGLATTVKWDLPEGFKAGGIQWPYPQKIVLSDIVTYGFEGEIFLISEIVPPESFPTGQAVTVGAKVNYLACFDICIPGEAHREFSLPVNDSEPEINLASQESFFIARSRHPEPWEQSVFRTRISAADLGSRYHLVVDDQSQYGFNASQFQDVYFFPEPDDLIDHAQPQQHSHTSAGEILELVKSDLNQGQHASLKGVLVFVGPGSFPVAIELDVPLSTPVLSEKVSRPSGDQASIWLAFLFAFLGGLILNFMPCVLPVLSLKVLHLIEQSRHERKKVWRHGVAFTLGVLTAFWALAGLLIFLRLAGEQIGWGFQFQSPVFLIFLSILFLVLAINLFGVFEIGTSLTATRGRLKATTPLVNSFLNGILATIVATPCTAPFMGTAIGFAVTQPAFTALMIFTFLGMGMAAPVFILSQFPKLLSFVPKPGAWMVQLKIFFGFVLMSVVLWLAWVLGLQLGILAAARLIAGLIVIAFSLWIFGIGAGRNAVLKVFAAVFLVAGSGVSFSSTGLKRVDPGTESPPENTSTRADKIQWRAYTPEVFAEALKQDQPVFIDFTAAWCLSCQVNERIALNSAEVARKFRELGIIALKADWTNRSPEISRALADYGKSSIPLYVLYGRDKSRGPVFLPELITPGIVMDHLNRLEMNPKTTQP